MRIENFFSASYWFELMPGQLNSGGKTVFLSFLILMLIAAFITAMKRRKGGVYKKTLNRLYDFFSGNLIIAIAFFFLRYEAVPFLGARFWLAIWFIVMAVWLFYILKAAKGLPERKIKAEKLKEKQKYIP